MQTLSTLGAGITGAFGEKAYKVQASKLAENILMAFIRFMFSCVQGDFE